MVLYPINLYGSFFQIVVNYDKVYEILGLNSNEERIAYVKDNVIFKKLDPKKWLILIIEGIKIEGSNTSISQNPSSSSQNLSETYICHACSKSGHHIRHCPKLNETPAMTPYQGSKRCIGHYQCNKCYRKWVSISSFANDCQQCSKCKIAFFAKKQFGIKELLNSFKYWNKLECIVIRRNNVSAFPEN